jgi:hypothetical protein
MLYYIVSLIPFSRYLQGFAAFAAKGKLKLSGGDVPRF